ncbi:putative MFS family arabinose efflux permease [Nocardioides albertanoniae]|uniref:Putative MFS family arabinose efflux permease n=1 Tax=Nocardioides albertanoniae TaxID=1175486 RepID=A0A543A2F9_9ACTN|nr:MFS transporter [Nocardioides albertanoniae]TQL66764.1 putative MFS family arabinose efflux permease [Nocardioides albertanoniae]
MTAAELEPSTALGRDFNRLWLATATSQAGSTIAYGALPLVAVLALDSSTFQVSLLAALSGFAAAAAGIRLGPWIEYRRKRPTMIGADLIRFAAMLSVPTAGLLDALTYAQLCVVGVIGASCELAFTAASGAHLKALVAPETRLTATSRLETTFWTTFTAGPPIGGALVSAFGPTLTVLVDAMTYLLSALGIGSIRTPEPDPPTRAKQRWRTEVTAGWRYILARRNLRSLFLNAALFGSCVIATSPLQAVLTLRELGMEPWMYGIAMGVPCLGGIVGALCTPRLTSRLGERTVLLTSGVARTLWTVPIAFTPGGPAGFVWFTAANFGLILCAGVFNPTFATYRMRETADDHMSRVQAAWSITMKIAQPVGVLAAGTLAAATSPRTAIAVAGGVLLLSSFLLPWRAEAEKICYR